jgi:hypothetical protein
MNTPSAAAQIIITVIPIVGIIMGGLVLLFYLYYGHREKMLMIEKGASRKINFDIRSFSMFAGILLFCIGLCLTLFFAVKEGVRYSLLSGIIPLSCGTGLIVFYVLYTILHRKDAER